MLKITRRKQKSVAEKVADYILDTKKGESGSDSADEETAAKIIEYDDEEYQLPQEGTTEFRKRNIKFLSEQSEKYKGQIVSRKDFENVDSDEEDVYEHSDSSDDEAFKNNRNNQQPNSIDSEHGSEDLEQESIDSENDYNDDSELDSVCDDEDNEVISNVNHEAEIQKGLCVQNQLRIWERLLELRINLQKILNKTNHLPSPHELKDLERINNKHVDIQKSTCEQTFQLLQNICSLKNSLSSQFPEIEKTTKVSLKRQLPYKDQDSGELPLKQISQYLENGYEQFRSYRNDVLLKWYDRTKLLQPGAGSKKKTFNDEYDIIRKIDNALINKSTLIEKSQQFKNATQNESKSENVRNPNIYDDSDFYHQQLRELIEYKANTTSNMGEITKQFLELQKIRQKMKKKVDTKASKGRKLRYIVHNKLINFMAPHNNVNWTMESIDELSKSLFA